MNRNLMRLLLLAIFLVMILFVVRSVFAVQVPKITWCHVEPNGNSQTLELPAQALQQAGHMDANGNPLHAGDHAGACVVVTPTITPTATPTPTINPCSLVLSRVVVNPCVTPTITPTVTPTATPTATPTPRQGESASANASSPGAPTCQDERPTGIANIIVEANADREGRLTVRWMSEEPRASRAHIRYSEDDGQWRYALLETENDGVEEIGGLKSGQHYWFQVAQVNGCAVGPWSKSYDPLVP